MSLADNFSQRLHTWQDKFNALTLREKLIIGFAGIFLSVYFVFLGLLEPTIAKLDSLQKEKKSFMKQLVATNTQVAEINTALAVDPNEKIKIEIAELRKQLLKVEADLATVMTDYVAPTNMSAELTSLLQANSAVRVISMAVLPPQRIDQDSDSSLPHYYRHSFSLTVEGDYFALMEFVEKVTKQNRQFGIQDFDYKVKEYPLAHLTISLMTISDSENVIRL